MCMVYMSGKAAWNFSNEELSVWILADGIFRFIACVYINTDMLLLRFYSGLENILGILVTRGKCVLVHVAITILAGNYIISNTHIYMDFCICYNIA